MKTLDENTQLAIQWIQDAIDDYTQLGYVDEWLVESKDIHDESTMLIVGDKVLELSKNLPKYIEVIRLLNDNNQESLSRACELAEELK